MIKNYFLIFVVLTSLTAITTIENLDNTLNDPGCPSEWVYHSNGKCYKSFANLGNVSKLDAEALCLKEDPLATLIIIHNKEIQDFVYKNVFTVNSGMAWIGLEYTGTKFEWTDNSLMDYHHWDDRAIIDGNVKCVAMELTNESGGVWNTTDCSQKSALVGCETTPLSLRDVLARVIKLVKLVNKQQNTIADLQKTCCKSTKFNDLF
ncbi:snaclec agglucetin subunit beta-1-like [Oppia nitens]|uniref:snaclec agglucetin subunit beta-1-like n=1 Tax=Oppia nitens TaxID=1686743 RepID=UPI0023DC0878|nr:snaclec agglucetin subunit beta-1-like [Oppia nitens]